MNLKSLARDVVIGLSAAGLALLMRWAIDPLLGDRAPYAPAYIFIVITAWMFSARAAVCTMLAFYPVANYFFVLPRAELNFAAPQDAVGFAINIILATILIFLGSHAKRTSIALGFANSQLGRANKDLAAANEDLEKANKALAAANEELATLNERHAIVNEQLANANAELTEMSQRKDQFLATLSHELRNPLSPILMSANLLERSKFSDETSATAVQVLIRQTRHMSALLDDLLDKRRIATGRFELKRALVDVRDCIDDAVECHRALLNAKQQNLKITVPETNVNAWVDRRRVTQMVANILGNAAKHTKEQTEIEVSLTQNNGEIVISVTDTGSGIDPNVLPHIFEPFYTVRTRDGSGGGLGIGLTLTKGLAEIHGGTIAVTSPGIGKGSKFTITLPAGQGLP